MIPIHTQVTSDEVFACGRRLAHRWMGGQHALVLADLVRLHRLAPAVIAAISYSLAPEEMLRLGGMYAMHIQLRHNVSKNSVTALCAIAASPT